MGETATQFQALSSWMLCKKKSFLFMQPQKEVNAGSLFDEDRLLLWSVGIFFPLIIGNCRQASAFCYLSNLWNNKSTIATNLIKMISPGQIQQALHLFSPLQKRLCKASDVIGVCGWGSAFALDQLPNRKREGILIWYGSQSLWTKRNWWTYTDNIRPRSFRFSITSNLVKILKAPFYECT